jgi:hypothetical protein
MKFYFELNIKRCLTLCIFILNFILSEAQNDYLNHQKYWYYRMRLLKSFMVVGDCDGCSIPANQRHYRDWEANPARNSTLKFGDGTIVLGVYISVLATEYHMLTQTNQSTIQTRKELYYALKAFNRLDLKQEECMNMGCIQGLDRLNGFFMREDIPPDFLVQHPELVPPNETSPLTATDLKTDYVPYAGNGSQCVEESQDQAISMLMGLKLCAKYIPQGCYFKGDNDNLPPFTFQDGETDLLIEAKAITKRIVKYMKDNGWMLYRPCGGGLANGGHGGNVSLAYAYALSKIAFDITNDSYFEQENQTINYCIWLGAVDAAILTGGCTAWHSHSMTYQLMAIGGDVNFSSCLLTNAFSNDRTILANQSSGGQAGKCAFEWMPLLHAIFENYNLTSNLWPNTYADYLNSAPCKGPYGFHKDLSDPNVVNDPELIQHYPYSQGLNVPHYNWSSPNLLYKPGTRWNNTTDPGSGAFFGEYNGLDYMLLYNLYRINQLRQDNNLNIGYQNLLESNININVPINAPLGPDLGSHSRPLTSSSFVNITSSSKINANGDMTFRAGKEIALKPGFEVHSTADFHAYIDDLTCNTTDNYYYRTSGTSTPLETSTNHKENTIVIAPNPSKGFVTISSSFSMRKIRVKDLSNKIVFNSEDFNSPSMELDLTALAKGLYIVEVLNGSNNTLSYSKLAIE